MAEVPTCKCGSGTEASSTVQLGIDTRRGSVLLRLPDSVTPPGAAEESKTPPKIMLFAHVLPDQPLVFPYFNAPAAGLWKILFSIREFVKVGRSSTICPGWPGFGQKNVLFRIRMLLRVFG